MVDTLTSKPKSSLNLVLKRRGHSVVVGCAAAWFRLQFVPGWSVPPVGYELWSMGYVTSLLPLGLKVVWISRKYNIFIWRWRKCSLLELIGYLVLLTHFTLGTWNYAGTAEPLSSLWDCIAVVVLSQGHLHAWIFASLWTHFVCHNSAWTLLLASSWWEVMGTVKYPSMHRTASHNKIVLLMVPKVQKLCSTKGQWLTSVCGREK